MGCWLKCLPFCWKTPPHILTILQTLTFSFVDLPHMMTTCKVDMKDVRVTASEIQCDGVESSVVEEADEAAVEEGQDSIRSSLPWKTLLATIGCYILGTKRHENHGSHTKALTYMIALLISISHYVFFRALEGKDPSASSSLSQPQVTTISLLLVTAFRFSNPLLWAHPLHSIYGTFCAPRFCRSLSSKASSGFEVTSWSS